MICKECVDRVCKTCSLCKRGGPFGIMDMHDHRVVSTDYAVAILSFALVFLAIVLLLGGVVR